MPPQKKASNIPPMALSSGRRLLILELGMVLQLRDVSYDEDRLRIGNGRLAGKRRKNRPDLFVTEC